MQTKQDYIPSILGKQYETANTQVECEETLHPSAHMMFCQNLIKELPDSAADITTQLSLKAGMRCWTLKGLSEAKYWMKQMQPRDTFKKNHQKDIIEEQK